VTLVCDVGPRDGLQNDAVHLAPAVRAELAVKLAGAGVPRVEVASFVNDRRVPQMAGAEELVAALPNDAGAQWSGLVLNERGYDRALATGLERINLTVAATESFCQRNQGTGREDALAMAERLAARATADGVSLTVTLAVAFGCPFEGPVPEDTVVAVAERLIAAEIDELVLADTIGVAVPTQVRALARRVRPDGCHFHDTRNTGVANAVAAIEEGVELLDASIGGTGGCPFAPGATGNVGTEDLLYVLDGMGVETGIDLDAILECSAWLAEQLDRPMTAALSRAGRFVVHG
jgi:isopropylmalate/homocitrate/citramalate synthase